MKPLGALLVIFCVIGFVYGGISWASTSMVTDTNPTPIAGSLMLTTGVVLLMKGGG